MSADPRHWPPKESSAVWTGSFVGPAPLVLHRWMRGGYTACRLPMWYRDAEGRYIGARGHLVAVRFLNPATTRPCLRCWDVEEER